ncbi:MAG TPA: hypothetical protein VGZ00_06330 [Candidatus Baltobacteraceae bacterium]|nr:hypothetical protein [Candidatus Baltobacteraceae bacterium]
MTTTDVEFDLTAKWNGEFLPPSKLGLLFEAFQHSAFRLEGLPDCNVPGDREEYLSYCEGAFLSKSQNSKWASTIRDMVNSGKAITRLRILPDPLTAYIRYEIEWGYVFNAVAGENILLISEESASSLVGDIPNDFWLFDNTRIADMQYGEDYSFMGAILREDERETRELSGIAGTLLSKAIPLQEYLRESRTKGISHSLLSGQTPTLKEGRSKGLHF